MMGFIIINVVLTIHFTEGSFLLTCWIEERYLWVTGKSLSCGIVASILWEILLWVVPKTEKKDNSGSLSTRDFESSTSCHWQAATYVEWDGARRTFFFRSWPLSLREKRGLKNCSFSENTNTRSEDGSPSKEKKRVNIQAPHGQYSQWGGLVHVPSRSRLQVTLETLDFSYSLLRPCNHHSGLRTAAFEVVNFAPFSQKSLVPRGVNACDDHDCQ